MHVDYATNTFVARHCVSGTRNYFSFKDEKNTKVQWNKLPIGYRRFKKEKKIQPTKQVKKASPNLRHEPCIPLKTAWKVAKIILKQDSNEKA